jgi:hypothetical protein
MASLCEKAVVEVSSNQSAAETTFLFDLGMKLYIS